MVFISYCIKDFKISYTWLKHILLVNTKGLGVANCDESLLQFLTLVNIKVFAQSLDVNGTNIHVL